MAEIPTKPTRVLAMLAQCHECMGHYSDGKIDCENTKCPLYTWMPARKKEPDLSWLKYNSKRVGCVTWEESSREISDEQRAKLVERFAKVREARR